ncbi:MAG: protein phosphatase 2C domain-containing protein [Clostridia bacterium]|nr:protein phosphatase 2C domain-containing protein [Clostridia bacterium]
MLMTAEKLQGVAHWLRRNAPCEDACFVMMNEDNTVCSAAVCDGASCCALGGPTANWLSQTVGTYMSHHFRRLYYEDDRTVRRELLGLIRNVQTAVGQMYRGSLNECGCTLVAAAMDSLNGHWMAVQLGDGVVIGRSRDGSLRQVTYSDKGQSAHATWLTIHSDRRIEEHLQIVRGDASGTDAIDAIFCTSDGLEGLFYAQNGEVAQDVSVVLNLMANDPDAGKTVIRALDGSQFHPDDDVSFAAMVNDQPVSACYDRPHRIRRRLVRRVIEKSDRRVNIG